MVDSGLALEYEYSNKIFFIYSNNYTSEINKINKNEYLDDVKLLEKQNEGTKIHCIYSLILKDKYKGGKLALEAEKNKEIYFSKIEIHDLLSEIFLFKIDFINKQDKNSLSKFALSYNEQFKKFVKLKETPLEIGLSDNYFKNLCLSSLNFIGHTNDSLGLDFLFNVFICSYAIQKQNPEEKLIKRFFEIVQIKMIDSKNIDIKYKKENKIDIEFCNNYLENFSKVGEILKELTKIAGKENLEKIHIILAYYYLKYCPKNFISLVSLKDDYTEDLFKNLTKNRKLFNDFSSDIIDFQILDDTQNIRQIENLLKYLPNMEELFKEFISNEFFLKVSGLSEIENKFINVLSLIKPNEKDDIEKIYNYFLIIIQMCEIERIMIFKLEDNFFLKYSELYAKNNLKNLKYIKEMYKIYSKLIKLEEKDQKKVIDKLNEFYYNTGTQLFSQGKYLKNEEIINFFQEIRGKEIKISPDEVAKMIDLQSASEEFRNNFLNNDFKRFDLKATFNKGFHKLISLIFEKFQTQRDFLVLKNWKISPNVNEEVLEIAIKRVIEVLNKEAKQNILFTDLIDFLCSLFSTASRKFNNLIELLKNLENNFPSSKLIEIYFRILYKGQKIYPVSNIFQEHLIEYIKKKTGEGALSIWYKLVTIEQKERLVYLYQNLKPEHAVKKEDFVEYPYKIEERIALFTYLYFAKYFTYNYITELDYYKNSINSKKELMKLPYEKGMKIRNNYTSFFRLFKVFIPIKQYKEEDYILDYTSFYDILSSYKVQYESLNSIKNYWIHFFKTSKKDNIDKITELIKSLEKTPLDEFDSKKTQFKEYLTYLNEAQDADKLHKSIIFMGIYKNYKNEGGNEKEIFDKANKEFQKLKELETNQDLNNYKDFKSIMVEYYIKNRQKLIKDELNFIQNYFGLNKSDNEENQNRFTIEKILKEIEKNIDPDIVIAPQKEEEHKIDEKNKPECLKIIDEKYINLINFYKIYANNNDFIKKYAQYFKDLLLDDKIIELESDFFNKDILNKIEQIYFCGFECNAEQYLLEQKEIYIISDLFEIIEIYKEKKYINDEENLCISVKNIFPLFSGRMEFKGFNKDFEDIQKLFTVIIDSNKVNEKEFSKCFINILIREIKKENINSKNDLDKILKYVIESKFLIDDCIPLINDLYEDRFFKKFNSRENRDIVINDNYLSLLDKYCNNNKPLKEKLLFYFESNINKILNEQSQKILLNDRILRERIKKSVSFLENQNVDCQKNLSLLFVIAFLKVFIIKYINIVVEDPSKGEDFYNKIFTEKSDLLSYYSLKIYFDIEGNYFDLLRSDKALVISENIISQIKKEKKQFGFDYLFLPMNQNDLDKYKDIISDIKNNLDNKLNNDKGIIQDLNIKMDIFCCVLVNLFLSKFNDQDYFKKDEFDILLAWYKKKLKNNEFKILNQNSKNIIERFINMKEKKIIQNEKNKYLIPVLFALRLVLNSLSPNNNIDPFFNNLIQNTKNTISKNSKIFFYFFNDNKKEEKALMDYESFHLIKFILLSHLLFASLLKNIDLDYISAVTKINIEDKKNSFNILSKEFESIIKIIRYKGIKSKYSIIYINIIFEKIKSIKLSDITDESNIKYLLPLAQDHYIKKIKSYFEQNQKKNDEKNEINEFKKTIFEDFNYYKTLKKDSYLQYFTTPNFCTIDDFKYQYKLSGEYTPIIDFVLNKKMDNVINILNSLPEINSLINKNYYENILNKTREELKNEKISSNEIIRLNLHFSNIKKLLKFDFKELSNDATMLDICNIENNQIYNMYASLDNFVKNYNNFLFSIRLFIENKNNLQTLFIQDFSQNDCFNNLAFDRLLQLIILYSKRNRYDKEVLNVYDGEKLDYDFESIENQLLKELLSGKKPLKNQQRLFIFSNEVFANKRNTLLSDFIIKYPQDKKNQKEKIDKFKESFERIEENKDDIKTIYHNLQYIIIYLMENNLNNKKFSLKNLSGMLNRYKVHNLLNSNDYYIENIFEIYEIVEMKCFDIFKDIFTGDKNLNSKYLKIGEKKKNEIKEYFESDDLLLDENIIENAIIKFLLRYCLGDHENSEEILKNMNIDKIFLKEDIWDEKILNDKKFQEEIKKLKSLNNGNNKFLEKYFLSNIFKIEEKDSGSDSDEGKSNSDSDGEN